MSFRTKKLQIKDDSKWWYVHWKYNTKENKMKWRNDGTLQNGRMSKRKYGKNEKWTHAHKRVDSKCYTWYFAKLYHGDSATKRKRSPFAVFFLGVFDDVDEQMDMNLYVWKPCGEHCWNAYISLIILTILMKTWILACTCVKNEADMDGGNHRECWTGLPCSL